MTTLAPKLPWDHPYAPGYPRIGSQATPTDADCIDYLTRLEAADGAGVENSVAMAIQSFILGCKADNAGYAGDPTRTNWDAIQACCVMAGARTISGALVPLKRPYGPELVDIDNLPTPTIEDYDGSVGAWDAVTRTASDTSPLTVTVSYPRFKFPFPSVVAGKQYRVSGRFSGNLDVLYQGKGLRLGSTYVSAVDPVTGVFDSVITQSGYAGLELVFDGSPLLSSVRIESLSIREDSFTPTPYNFSSGDYSRGGATPGLKGNGVDKYIDTNRAANADGQNDAHLAVYSTANPTIASRAVAGEYKSATTSGTQLSQSGSSVWSRCRTVSATTSLSFTTGLIAVSRDSDASYNKRAGLQSSVVSTASVATSSQNVFVFGLDEDGVPSGLSDARLAFYSIGSALDLSLLDARVTALVRGIQFAQYTGLSPADYDDATVAYIVNAYTNGGTL